MRLISLCSDDDDDFKAQCNTMSTFFLKRGYPKTVIDRALDSVSRKNRTCALTPKRKSNSDRVPLVLTYHPHNIAIRNILLQNFNTIVLKDQTMANIFPSPPLTAFVGAKVYGNI